MWHSLQHFLHLLLVLSPVVPCRTVSSCVSCCVPRSCRPVACRIVLYVALVLYAIAWWCVMLCHVMSCYVVLCCAVLCCFVLFFCVFCSCVVFCRVAFVLCWFVLAWMWFIFLMLCYFLFFLSCDREYLFVSCWWWIESKKVCISSIWRQSKNVGYGWIQPRLANMWVH